MIKQEILTTVSSVLKTVGEIEKDYHVFTDSRTLLPGGLFVALDGPHHRGVHFIDKCVDNEARVLVLKNDKESKDLVRERLKGFKKIGIIYVEDTLVYLQEIAREHLKEWKKGGGQIIGLTGSNGKTTCKEMLLHLLQQIHKTEHIHATYKNLNNHIGVPLTLLKLTSKHRFGIIEMGTNHPGEIHKLCQIALPDCGFITNIGESHLEFLLDNQGVFQEKKALYNSIKKENGLFVINQDDLLLQSLAPYKHSVSYGTKGTDFQIRDCHRRGFSLKVKSGEVLKIENPQINGDFNYFNLGQCVSLLLTLFPQKKQEILAGAATFSPPQNNRSTWIDSGKNKFFVDAYNANPASMEASLKFFLDLKNDHSLVILGDMNELGDKSKEYHQKIGSLLKSRGCKKAVFIGRYRSFYNQGFGGEASCYKNLADFLEVWPSYLAKFKIFFIKGSRSLQLESLVAIKKE